MESKETHSTEPENTTMSRIQEPKQQIKSEVIKITTEFDIDKTPQETEFELNVADYTTNKIQQGSFSIFSVNTSDYKSPSIESENITESPIQELILAGESQSEFDYITSSQDIEYNSSERPPLKVPSEINYDGIPAKHEKGTEFKEILTTASKKIDEKYKNLSTAFVTDRTETSIQPHFTQTKQDSSAYSESNFDNESVTTIGSENTKDFRIKELTIKGTDVESSSSSSQTLKEVTTIPQDDEDNSGQKRNHVLLPSEVTKIATPLKPENITELEEDVVSLTLHETQEHYSYHQLHEEYETTVEENYLDLNEDSRNIAEIEMEADELLSDDEKSLRAEDQKFEKSTNPFVNVQKKAAQDFEELKKISDIIDNNLKPSINTKTGEEYSGDQDYSTFSERSNLDSSENDVSVEHLLNLSGEGFDEDARFEMNLNASDERIVATEIEEYPTDEFFVSAEEVHDCSENITCLSEMYEDQRSMLFSETDSLNEETTEQYNFDVYVQSSYDDDNNDTIETTISNETDHDYNEDIDLGTYNGTFLYADDDITDNITNLAESAQIISHEVPIYYSKIV